MHYRDCFYAMSNEMTGEYPLLALANWRLERLCAPFPFPLFSRAQRVRLGPFTPPPSKPLEKDGDRYRRDREHQKPAASAANAKLISESMRCGEGEAAIIPALEGFPAWRFQQAQAC